MRSLAVIGVMGIIGIIGIIGIMGDDNYLHLWYLIFLMMVKAR